MRIFLEIQKKTIKRLMIRLSDQKKKLIIVGLSTLLGSASYAVMPLLVGSAIDNLVTAIRSFNGSLSVIKVVTDALFIPVQCQ